MKIEYEEANLSIFVDNRILYMKILLEKLLEVISELNKFTRYKVNAQISIYALYSINEQTEVVLDENSQL